MANYESKKAVNIIEKFIIATGASRTTKIWKNTSITWDELVRRLQTTTRTPETQGEYRNMTKSQKDNVKDVGGFVGGRVINGSRKAGNIERRYLLTLDADFASPDLAEWMDLFWDYTYCLYSTHTHTPEKPRLRVVMPLSRPCTPDEYEAVSRIVAKDIGIDYFDDTTYQAHRLMYWPSTPIDGQYLFKHEEARPVDVDAALSRYRDWRDVSTWPISSRTVKNTERLIKNQEDPTAKNGLVGAFCRVYTVEEAMDKFLPGVYTPCAMPNRYTYAEGSTAAGVVIYNEGKFAYSNHATDPVRGKLCNAWDLVRLHKYGELDEEAAPGTPTVKLPSYTAMQEFVSKDSEVRLLMHRERMAEAKADFSDLAEEEESDDWVLDLAVDGKGRYAATIDNVKKILEKDPRLKGKMRLNEFTWKPRVCGPLPWNDDDDDRDWKDADDAGLRHYLEHAYGVKGKGPIDDAWLLVVTEHGYHPVREYLNSLTWDGAKRIERVFIDFLGAEDTEYIRTVTKKSLVAAVARVMDPGCKHDTMIVLVGPQGCGKSQTVRRLGCGWFTDTLTTVQGKEAYEQIQGFWIVEIAELAAMKRSEVEAIKNFVGKSEDTYRAAYGRHTETNKRQCVFIGTTNTHDFLKDQTGNRRFFPVDVHPEKAIKSIWKELMPEEVGQIWAEAVVLYRKGETTYLDDPKIEAMAQEEQDRHLEVSPLTGDVRKFLDAPLPEGWEDYDLTQRRMYYGGGEFGKPPVGIKPRERVCAMEIWCELLGGEKKDLTIQRSKEIKDIILKTGEWEATKSNISFGLLYGKQKGYLKKQTDKVL